jgi:hypothetical protein
LFTTESTYTKIKQQKKQNEKQNVLQKKKEKYIYLFVYFCIQLFDCRPDPQPDELVVSCSDVCAPS